MAIGDVFKRNFPACNIWDDTSQIIYEVYYTYWYNYHLNGVSGITFSDLRALVGLDPVVTVIYTNIRLLFIRYRLIDLYKDSIYLKYID